MTGCSSAPAPTRDPTQEAWYSEATRDLTNLNREAHDAVRAGKPDRASELIQQGEPIATRLVAVPHPTLAATEGASDLDDLYGRMLLSNRHYGWARLLFQKNVSRWKHWQPQTPDTARRLQEAQAAIAECDRHINQ